MLVFASWSGAPSKEAALLLRSWIPTVLHFVEVWVSEEDIDKGKRWGTELAGTLDEAKYGLVCVTPGNQNEPWLNFEAGAVARSLTAHLSPVLIGVEPREITGPLAQFQCTRFDREDFWKLIKSINKVNSNLEVPEDKLKITFDLAWPGLEQAIHALDLTHLPTTGESVEVADPKMLRDEEIAIMQFLGEHFRWYPSIDQIQQALGKNIQRTQYFIDQLEEKDYVSHSFLGGGTKYRLTKPGRAALVENDLDED